MPPVARYSKSRPCGVISNLVSLGRVGKSPEEGDQGGGKADKTEVGVGEFVIARGDAAEVFDPFEEVFHEVSATVGA